MLNFVLIHGSWHTGAHWTPVVGHLHQAGHQAFAPTVLGHGEGVEKRVNDVQQVDDLVNQLIRRNLHDIVLVGHSYAGTLTARLAESDLHKSWRPRGEIDRGRARLESLGVSRSNDYVRTIPFVE